jgi:hypothetical protein
MSAAEQSGDTVPPGGPAPRPPVELSPLHARRREARRQRHLARVDLGLGLLGAVILVVATPGLAITGLIALIVLVACLATFAHGRRARSKRREASRREGASSSEARGRRA